MNKHEIRKAEQDGKLIAQQNGVTFSVFRDRVKPLLKTTDWISEDLWICYFQDYCFSISAIFGTPEEFAKEYFGPWDECPLKQ